MIAGRWWDRYPDVLAAEQASLSDLGVIWSQDETAFNAGVMRFVLRAVDVGGEAVDLIVTYPDLYPYFRFEIDAPGLNLSRHQNPFVKNLCLMGRATDNWRVGATAGKMINEQVPRVVEAAHTESVAEAEQIEEHQGEPISDYYSYLGRSMVLLEGTIQLDRTTTSGSFRIGTREPIGPAPNRALRGALTKVFDQTGRKIAEASQAILELYNSRVLKGPWLRLEQPPPVNGGDVLEFLREQDPRFRNLPRKPVEGGDLSVGAAVFPEEHSWRDDRGDGWIFVCEFIQTTSR